LIQAGIKKAVVAMTDPNPLVAGRGLNRMRDAGIEVIEGVLSQEAACLNEVFIKWITTKMPFVVLKTAMTLDGKIATYTGHSRWITSPPARRRVHELRDRYDGILAGIGTVLADNPELTTRLPEGGKNPVRIIVDSLARTPLTAKVMTDGLAPTIIAVSPQASLERVAALQTRGAEVLTIASETEGRVNLQELFKLLGLRGITSILVEGGASINASLLSANLVDKVYWFIAPKLVGGSNSPSPVGGQGVPNMDNAYLLEDIKNEFIGEDILISAYLRHREGRDVYRACGRIG
jgi:diaminohydroxyphosphoribosylaminopyrimidine deaminase/5-amino-6-(5-phosphoribosylamino)uracil reductase